MNHPDTIPCPPPFKPRRHAKPKDWQCQECGLRMTAGAAERRDVRRPWLPQVWRLGCGPGGAVTGARVVIDGWPVLCASYAEASALYERFRRVGMGRTVALTHGDELIRRNWGFQHAWAGQ